MPVYILFGGIFMSGFTSHGYHIGWNLVSSFSAIHLKLSHLQVEILNLFIMNWLADKLEKFDADNPANQLYRFNVYHFADHYGISRVRMLRNLEALTNPITCLDGIRKQVMFRNKKQHVMYVGMELSIIHQIVNPRLYNQQCDHHRKPHLKCPFESTPIINDMEPKNRTISGLLPSPIRKKPNCKEPLFDIGSTMKKCRGNKTHTDWAEGVVKRLCEMAIEHDACLLKDGKSINVFPHLKNGEFNKRRSGIDRACYLVDLIGCGAFFRRYYPSGLFGAINKDFLQLKNIDMAIERLTILMKTGNKYGIEKFIFKCARNFFEALKPGKETYQSVKGRFPISVHHFLLQPYQNGKEFVANFLMYYSSTLTETDMKTDMAVLRVKKIVPESVFDKLLDYETYLLEHHISAFWMNIHKLAKEITGIKNRNETSYPVVSCFDIVFKKVDDVSERYHKVLPGYFNIEKSTVTDALVEIKNK